MSRLYPALSCSPAVFTSAGTLHCMLRTLAFLRFEMWPSLILWAFIISRASLFLLGPCICPQILYGKVLNWDMGQRQFSGRLLQSLTIFQKHVVTHLAFPHMHMYMYLHAYMQIYMCGDTRMCLCSLYACGGLELVLGLSRDHSSIFFFWGRVSESNSTVTDLRKLSTISWKISGTFMSNGIT